MNGLEVLTVVFIVLKLCGVIEWSWVWVLAPTWVAILFALVIFGIVLVNQVTKDSRFRKARK